MTKEKEIDKIMCIRYIDKTSVRLSGGERATESESDRRKEKEWARELENYIMKKRRREIENLGIKW